MIETVTLKKIRLDGGTQPRVKIDTDVVADYAERLNEGDEFPAVEVFHDGASYWLADGFHRYHAHAKAEKKNIRCNVRKGTVREAILFSCGANISHGVRRTNKDKRQVVETLLADSEWVKFSDRKIADICCVSHPFVSEVRRQVVIVTTSNETRVGSDGKSYPATNGKEPTNVRGMDEVRPDLEADSVDDGEHQHGSEETQSAPSNGVQRRQVAEATGERARASVVDGGRGDDGSSDADGQDDDGEDPEPAPRKGKAGGENVIGDVIRQVTSELQFGTETLADYQVQAIYEGVRLWMAADLEKRGIK